jgi:16S rRNA (guanine527-N7)-methyltransferase
VAKKITFQRQMVRSLGLTNVTPHHGRAEELAKQRTAAFDWVVARAFSDLLSLGRLARPFLKTGGALLAMKGGEGEQEAEGAADELARLGYASLHCQQLKLPGSNDRRTLVVARLVT